MHRDPRKAVCDELAEQLSTPEGLRTARLLELQDILSPQSPPIEATTTQPSARLPHPATPSPEPISIWQPLPTDSTDGGTQPRFGRPPPHPLGDHYARRPVIEARKPIGTRRICWFGESVAAGYLLAPHFTPAEELQRRLLRLDDDANFDVVDLSRTNETLGPMVTTLEQSLQLEPDLWILFAGNNWNLLETSTWSPYVPSVRSRQLYGLALRQHGLNGPIRLARQQLRQKVTQTFEAIAEMANRHEIPVIVVIPEVNLADWEDRQPVPWLPGDGCHRWYEIYARAIQHLSDGQVAETLRLADDLLELDGGLCTSTHRLRARALATDDRLAEARTAAEAEVEAGRYASQAFLSAPRISTSEQDLLRTQATHHGFTSVDLPRHFAEVTGSPLPGRRLFLDYCHLTVEGVEIAMQAVADKVLHLSRLTPEPTALWQVDGPRDAATTCEIAAAKISPAVSALAKLGAAIHSAHRLLTVGDHHPTLLGWCRDALADDPNIAKTLRDLLIARCSPCPAVMTVAQQRQSAERYPLLLQHGWRWDYLDADLLLVGCQVLAELAAPVSCDTLLTSGGDDQHIRRLLLEHHQVRSEGVELTRPPYLWQPLERFYPEAMATRGLTGRAVYRSPWPTSSFCLVTDATHTIELTATVRLPRIENATASCRGPLSLHVNNLELGSHQLDLNWTRWDVVIAPSSLQCGLNRVTLKWPPPGDVGDLALANTLFRLENGLEADLHPTFGEVFSLRASRS